MRRIDYITETDAVYAKSLKERELKASDSSFVFASSVTAMTKHGSVHAIDTKDVDHSVVFAKNFEYWNKETQFMSVNNLDNSYFKGIVNMGVDAVPYILAEIKIKPSQLVHALDLIFPGVMKYEGYVSLKTVCEKWISILNRTGRFS